MSRSTKILIAVCYAIFPLDFLPDLIPVLGWIDDVAVLAYAFMSPSEEKTLTT